MALFGRRQPAASLDTIRHLQREAGAYRSLADTRARDAREAPTATGRARLKEGAKDARRRAREFEREARRLG
ncbi:hypothetical protein ACIQGZ_17075 [Streptomyces sp. NPDC092296]|uniref:hypothetical protein n=1 Tax=Streptomyces sp. NPDC092296 TaxID=3366012 RepID=UPI0038302570